MIIACAVLASLGIFFSFTTGLQKSFKKQPAATQSDVIQKSKSLAEDTESQRKRLMEDRQYRLDSHNNR